MLSGDLAIELWEQVREKLRHEAGETVFQNWLGLLSLSSYSNGKIVIAIHSKFHKDWIEPRYGNRIRSLWHALSTDVLSVTLIVDERLAGRVTKKSEDASSSILNLSSPLDPRYTFDKFVVGPSNDFVAAAAQRISDSEEVSFKDAVIRGLAPDGGLYLGSDPSTGITFEAGGGTYFNTPDDQTIQILCSINNGQWSGTDL